VARQPFLKADDVGLTSVELALGLLAEADRLFLRLELRLASQGLGFVLGLLKQELAASARGRELGAPGQPQPRHDQPTADHEPDDDADRDTHALPLSESETRDERRGAHPPPSRRGRMPRIEYS